MSHENTSNGHPALRWIWFITGPTACGKSTIAASLASSLNFKFLEGDSFHPAASVEKMSQNQPLTDADREGWLQALREHESQAPKEGESRHLIMTCSALKKHYRDILRRGGQEAADLRIRFVMLLARPETLKKRAETRKGHFAGKGLVDSQFEALEKPGENEKDVSIVDVEGELENTKREVETRVREAMGMEDGSFTQVL
ncbi:P-loop containing nucleoside triphosphate hydrolase protein [Triangularia verruculosa]|uniref:Gluconokinase n=1 Tax=Triangularia verruculosa TaxID=2587418 RepID=A0AAN7AWK5_9PEZI|nr:P-loop containing nucleoside triphosphate hydrolase protein [Triangularia verruculosa]